MDDKQIIELFWSRSEDAIAKTKGIKCGFKNTSCPDQLARALEAALSEE